MLIFAVLAVLIGVSGLCSAVLLAACMMSGEISQSELNKIPRRKVST